MIDIEINKYTEREREEVGAWKRGKKMTIYKTKIRKETEGRTGANL